MSRSTSSGARGQKGPHNQNPPGEMRQRQDSTEADGIQEPPRQRRRQKEPPVQASQQPATQNSGQRHAPRSSGQRAPSQAAPQDEAVDELLQDLHHFDAADRFLRDNPDELAAFISPSNASELTERLRSTMSSLLPSRQGELDLLCAWFNSMMPRTDEQAAQMARQMVAWGDGQGNTMGRFMASRMSQARGGTRGFTSEQSDLLDLLNTANERFAQRGSNAQRPTQPRRSAQGGTSHSPST